MSHDTGDFFVVVEHLQTRLANIVAGPTTTRQFRCLTCLPFGVVCSRSRTESSRCFHLVSRWRRSQACSKVYKRILVGAYDLQLRVERKVETWCRLVFESPWSA